MQAHKETGQAVGAEALAGLAGFAPPTLHSLGARVASGLSRRLFNLVVTNVPGPQFPLYAGEARGCSRPTRSCPLAKGQAVSIGLTSYDGGVFYGLNADRDAMPDVDVLAQCLEDALAELRGDRAVSAASMTRRAAARAGAGRRRSARRGLDGRRAQRAGRGRGLRPARRRHHRRHLGRARCSPPCSAPASDGRRTCSTTSSGSRSPRRAAAGYPCDYDQATGGEHPGRPRPRIGSSRLLLRDARQPRQVPPLAVLASVLPEGRGSLWTGRRTSSTPSPRAAGGRRTGSCGSSRWTTTPAGAWPSVARARPRPACPRR